MFCAQCQHDISDCTCTDIEERLEKLGQHTGWVFERCCLCGRLKSRCLCRFMMAGALRFRKCRRCKREFAHSDAHDYLQFCSDACQLEWWNLVETAAEIIGGALDTSPQCSSS